MKRLRNNMLMEERTSESKIFINMQVDTYSLAKLEWDNKIMKDFLKKKIWVLTLLLLSIALCVLMNISIFRTIALFGIQVHSKILIIGFVNIVCLLPIPFCLASLRDKEWTNIIYFWAWAFDCCPESRFIKIGWHSNL